MNSVLEKRESESVQSTSPYTVGRTINLLLEDGSLKVAEIEETYKPFTLSCVMRVRLSLHSDLVSLILKLYDRRYAAQLRSDYKARSWDTTREDEYKAFLSDGCALACFQRWDQKYKEDQFWRDDEMEDWADGKVEAYFQYLSLKPYNTERTAYGRMEDIQGRLVPKVFDKVSLHIPMSSGSRTQFNVVPGILLENVEEFPLTDLQNNAPRTSWQSICEDAISILQAIGDRGIVNRDVKTRSFIIRKDPCKERYDLRMIDFGLCFFHDDAESDWEFREWQALEDEGGAVGRVMATRFEERIYVPEIRASSGADG